MFWFIIRDIGACVTECVTMKLCWLQIVESTFLVGRLASLSRICWHWIVVFWDSIPQSFVPSSPFPSFWRWWWWTWRGTACCLSRYHLLWQYRVRIERLWGLLQILCMRGSPWGWPGSRPGGECNLPFRGLTVTLSRFTSLSHCLTVWWSNFES